MLKTNVIKKDYVFLIRNKTSGETMEIIINAESEESAKLQIIDGWEVIEKDEQGN